MKKTKKRQGALARSLAALLGEELSVSLPGEYRMELTGNANSARMLISSVDRLFICTAEEVVLLKRGERLRILGEELSCLTYSGGALEITGNINKILIESEAKT